MVRADLRALDGGQSICLSGWVVINQSIYSSARTQWGGWSLLTDDHHLESEQLCWIFTCRSFVLLNEGHLFVCFLDT